MVFLHNEILRVTGVLKLLYHDKVEAPTQEMLKALV